MNDPAQVTGKFTAIGFTSVFLWGVILPLVKLVTEDHGALGAVFTIHGIAGVAGITTMLLMGRLPLRISAYLSWRVLLRFMLFGSQMFALYFAARSADRESFPGIIFCNYLWPTLVLIYSVILAGIRVRRPAVMAAGLSMVLLALYFEFGQLGFSALTSPADLNGFVLATVAANLWGLYSAVTRRFADRQAGSGAMVPVFSLGCAALAGVLLITGIEPEPPRGVSGSGWPYLLAGCFNFVAYICWDIGIRKGNLVTLSLAADFIPWLSLLATAALLGVDIQGHTAVSAFILVTGAVTARLGTIPSPSHRTTR